MELVRLEFSIYFWWASVVWISKNTSSQKVCNWRRQRHSDIPNEAYAVRQRRPTMRSQWERRIFTFSTKLFIFTRISIHLLYLFTSGDVGKLRLFRLLCDDDELPITDTLSQFTASAIYSRFYWWSTFMKLKYAWHFHLSTDSRLSMECSF